MQNGAMNRVSVVGCPGSGKTTFAAELAKRLGTSHLELDSLYHQANWEPLPDEDSATKEERLRQIHDAMMFGTPEVVVEKLDAGSVALQNHRA